MVYRNYSQDQLEAQFVLDAIPCLDELFEERLKRSIRSRSRFEALLDVPYGTHHEQTLDVFFDKTVERSGLAQVFIHGGFGTR